MEGGERVFEGGFEGNQSTELERLRWRRTEDCGGLEKEEEEECDGGKERERGRRKFFHGFGGVGVLGETGRVLVNLREERF